MRRMTSNSRLMQVLSTFLLLISALSVGSCGNKDTPGSVPDKPPVVLISAPTGTYVGVNAAIAVMFDEDMNPWSFTPQSIIVSDGTGTIPGTLNYSGRMAIFVPDTALNIGTTYTVVVAASVEDLSGNPLGQPYAWQFSTFSNPPNEPPLVINTYPAGSATGVSINAAIIVSFSESMNVSSITPTSMFLTEKNQSDNVAGSVSASGATALMTPSAALKYDTEYIVTLVPGDTGSPGITDLAGNPLVANSPSGYTWAFRTEPFPIPVITAAAGAGGTISPSGSVPVAYQGSMTFTITPNTGYPIENVLVDDVSVGVVSSVPFTNVQANHTISASFVIN